MTQNEPTIPEHASTTGNAHTAPAKPTANTGNAPTGNELFERAPIPRAYFTMALPVVLSMVVTLVYNTVDTYFIAHTGNTAMVAGVSLATPVFTAMIAFGDIFGLGGASVISRLLGQGRAADARRLSVFCFWGAIATGLLVIAVGLTFQTPILRLLGADGTTMPHSAAFYRWIILGAPFIIVSFTPGNLLRTAGLPIPSMLGTVIGTVANIVINPIFIHVLGWGAAGSAGATFLANVIGDAYFVWVMVARCDALSLDPRLMFRRERESATAKEHGSSTGSVDARTRPTTPRLDITRHELGGILAIGIPASITNVTQSLGVILVNLYLLRYGTDAVAAMGIALKIVMIAVLVLVGFAFGAQPLIGYNYGRRDFVRLRGILRFTLGFECGLALAMTAVLWAAAHTLMGFFIADAAIVDLGAGMLRVQLPSAVCVAVVLVATATFQSTGKALGALALSASRQGVMLWAALAAGAAVAGYWGVVAAQAVSDLLTAVMAAVLFVVLLPELRRHQAESGPDARP